MTSPQLKKIHLCNNTIKLLKGEIIDVYISTNDNSFNNISNNI